MIARALLFASLAPILVAQSIYIRTSPDIIYGYALPYGTLPVAATSTWTNSSLVSGNFGVAEDSSGNAYAIGTTTSTGDTILKFAAGTGTGTGSPTSFAVLSSGTSFTGPMAIDSSGNVYAAVDVAGTGDFIYAYTSSGGGPTTIPGSGSLVPGALAVDGSGNLWEGEVGSPYHINKIIPSSGAVTLFASLGGSHSPKGITFDNSGNLYISAVSFSSTLIYKLAACGGAISTFSTISTNVLGWVAFDPVASNVYYSGQGASSAVNHSYIYNLGGTQSTFASTVSTGVFDQVAGPVPTGTPACHAVVGHGPFIF